MKQNLRKWLCAVPILMLFVMPLSTGARAAPQLPETETSTENQLYDALASTIARRFSRDGSTKTVLPGLDFDAVLEARSLVVQRLKISCPEQTFWLEEPTDADTIVVSRENPPAAYLQVAPPLQKQGQADGFLADTIPESVKPSQVTLDEALFATAQDAMGQARFRVWSAISGETVFEILTSIKHYLCEQTAYLETAPEGADFLTAPWQALSALDDDADTKTNSAGYAKAFQLAFDWMWEDSWNASCCIASDGERMWNLVRLGEESYLVDIAACDQGKEVFLLNGKGQLQADGSYQNPGVLTQKWEGSWEVNWKDETLSYDCDEASRLWGPDFLDLGGGQSFEAVTQVEISLCAPVKGVWPEAATVTALPENSVAAALVPLWKDQNGNALQGEFAPDMVYLATLTPTPELGYQFTDQTAFFINGTPADLQDGQLTVEFPPTEAPELTQLAITNEETSLVIPGVDPNHLMEETAVRLPLMAAGTWEDGTTTDLTWQVHWSLTSAVEGAGLEGSTLVVTNRIPGSVETLTVRATAAGSETLFCEKSFRLERGAGAVGEEAYLRIFSGETDLTGMRTETIYIPGDQPPATIQLRAVCCDGYGTPVDAQPSWSISIPRQGVRVTDQGLVLVDETAEAGDCVVRCATQKQAAYITVPIMDRQEVQVDFAPDTPSTVIYGDTVRFFAIAANGETPMRYSVRCDTGLAEMDPSTGALTAKSVGLITVRAELNGRTHTGFVEKEIEILPRTVTLTEVTVEPKVYDGTVDVCLSSARLDNAVDDSLTVTLGKGRLLSPNVSAERQNVLYSPILSGSCKNNYVLGELPELTLAVQPRPLTIIGFDALPRIYDPGSHEVEITDVQFQETEVLPSKGMWTALGRLEDHHPGTHTVELTLTLQDQDAARNYCLQNPKFCLEKQNIITPLPAPILENNTAAITVKAYHATTGNRFDCASLLAGIPAMEAPEICDVQLLDPQGGPLVSRLVSRGSVLEFDCANQSAGSQAILLYSIRSRNHAPITGLKLTITAAGKRDAVINTPTLPIMRYGTQGAVMTASVTYPGAAGGTWSWTGDGTFLKAEDLGGGRVRLLPLKPTDNQASLTVRYTSDTTEASYTWRGLEVKKGQIVITIPSLSIFLGDALPQLSELIPVITGLQQGDILERWPVLTFGTGAGSGLGRFDIIASGAKVPGNGCYEPQIAYVFGTLTVARRPVPPSPPLPELPHWPDWWFDGLDCQDCVFLGSRRNPDGSVTETAVCPDGIVIEVTYSPDDSVMVVETAPDGSVVIHEMDGAGNQAETRVEKDGSFVTQVMMTDGTQSRTEVDAWGNARAYVQVSQSAVHQALEENLSLDLPLPALEVDGEHTPEVWVELPDHSVGVRVAVPVLEPMPGLVALLVHPDGREEVVRKSVVDDFGLTLEMTGTTVVRLIDNSRSFADVPTDCWAWDGITFVTARNLYHGTGANVFSPNTGMTRGMLAQVLHNLEGNPTVSQDGSFTDVPEGLWCGEAIAWAARQGVLTGYSDGSFHPEKTITRQQLAAILYRYAGCPHSGGTVLDFRDGGTVSGYALDAMTWAVNRGILSGTTQGTLNPQGTATRAQVAVMLTRYLSQ